jgi:hypothetical protein
LIDVFCDGTIDDIHPSHKKKIELWVPHNFWFLIMPMDFTIKRREEKHHHLYA